MEITDLTEVLNKIPLFSSVPEDDMSSLSQRAEIRSFRSGENVSVPDECPQGSSVTVIVSGSVSVIKNDLLMRILSPGSVSGVASLYGNNGEHLSRLKANTAVSAAFLPGDSVRALIRKNPDFAESYIRFLTSRIRFLNNRIRAYTSGSVEAKLAFHLLYSDESGTGTVDTGLPMSALADMLSVGRASLYRAFDSLTECGAIRRSGSIITILNKEKLENTQKE